MKIEQHAVVSIHYTLTNNENEVLDSSEGQDPLTYLHGVGGLIPGLENELLGKEATDKLDVTVSPAEGYGELNQDLVQTMSKDVFQGVEEIVPGMQFRTQGPDGEGRIISVVEVNGDEVTVDGNHPLAGVTLNFKVEIVSVREATEEEIQHGHVH